MGSLCLGLFWYAVLNKCPFYFCKHLDEEDRAACFTYKCTLIVWLLVFCVSSSRCHGMVYSVDWSRVYDFGSSWSYSLV